jgi:beta-glucosidase/6-phospho-beta-glucosidase/beta-galactosidase
MRSIGANAYRFSIAWPRIFPQGTGAPNPKGIDFYDRLVDELIAAGIAPFATLYHWELPQALEDRGGWRSRHTCQAFADYAGYVAEGLGDRVGHFFTINEFRSFVDMGHHGKEVQVPGGTMTIRLAPGLKLSARELNQVRHHAVLAHGLANARVERAVPDRDARRKYTVAGDGRVYDTDRVMFLRSYLGVVAARHRRRRAGEGVLPLEHDGQTSSGPRATATASAGVR